MIWYLLISYVAISQACVVVAMVINYFDDQCQALDPIRSQTGNSKLIQVTLFFLTCFLMAPFVFPFMVHNYRNSLNQVDEEAEYWSSVQRSFTEFSLEPLHPFNRKPEFEAFLEAQSEAPVALGFESLGEVWLKNFEPFFSQGAFFLNHERTTIVEIAITADTNCLELMSFLEDGSMVTSASCETVEAFQEMKPHGYHIQCLPNLELDQLIPLHEEFVAAVTKIEKQPVRSIEQSNWKEYVHYNNRRFCQILFEIGEKDDAPEECCFPAIGNLNSEASKKFGNAGKETSAQPS